MKKQIILPNNNFGCAIMCTLLVLLFIVPFTITFWASSFIAPWWVAGPLALAIAIIVFAKYAKFKE